MPCSQIQLLQADPLIKKPSGEVKTQVSCGACLSVPLSMQEMNLSDRLRGNEWCTRGERLTSHAHTPWPVISGAFTLAGSR